MIDFMKLQNGSDIFGAAAGGTADEEVVLTEEVAGAIAGSFAYWLGFKVGKNPYDLRICVGRDPRPSGDVLREGILKGIAMFGAEGYDTGLAVTPAMYMSTALPQLDYDGAVMITGGNLPWNMNGFKLFSREGALDPEDTATILRTASKYNFVGEFYEERSVNALQIYAAYLRQMTSLGLRDVPGGLSGMHIVVDAGSGAGGFFAKDVLEPMGADISGSQFPETDGTLPGGQSDRENNNTLASMCKTVTECKADLGVVFDVDGSHATVIGPDGEPVTGNEIIALAAALAAEDYPGETVVTDSNTSDGLHEFLEGSLGLRHIRYKSGIRNIINKARELREDGEQVFLAAETSGHAAFSDNYFLDDGVFLALQIIINAAILKSKGRDLSALTGALRKPAESRVIKFRLLAEDSDAAGSRMLEDMEKWARETAGLELVTPNYDGVRVRFRLPVSGDGDAERSAGWFSLRKSPHDNAMTLSIESDTAGGVNKVLPVINIFAGRYEGVEISN
ncbi:MAG: phosphomannomutase/phosphoglucomutase [Mogibacterium sp.]|nr:phosphomannomutase/phosphoglucomutase [Mogibacterium sp.]